MIEFESGGKRQGVQTPEQAVALARAILGHPGLEFKGLMTYPTTTKTAEFLTESLPQFRKSRIEVSVVSGGGTPGAYQTHELAPVTELRVGTYIYNDRMMMAAQAATLEDCASAVLATVVSRPTIDRAIIDAGSKTLSSDLLAPPSLDLWHRIARERVPANGGLLHAPPGVKHIPTIVRKMRLDLLVYTQPFIFMFVFNS